MTTDQVRNQTKDVTRRLGWLNLKEGDFLNACVKCMGLKKGEKIEVICMIQVVSVRREPVNHITASDVLREGFSAMSIAEFIDFFCKGHHCKPETVVTRIEFEYIF